MAFPKVDFVHIGFHKTASTWLQTYGYPAHPQLGYLNDPRTPLDDYFSQAFVEVPEFFFDRQKFQDEFARLIEKHVPLEGKTIRCISEENLSGHFWNGSEGEKLAHRIQEVFGQTRIVLFVRDQLTYLISSYSNYLKHGGTHSLERLLRDQNLWGDRVIQKLCYDRAIQFYRSRFGSENVLVLSYEQFQKEPAAVLNRLFSWAGLPPVDLPASLFAKKINLRHSAPSETLLRFMNSYSEPYKNRAVRGFIKMVDRSPLGQIHRTRESVIAQLPEEAMSLWADSNAATSEFSGISLKDWGYPTSAR